MRSAPARMPAARGPARKVGGTVACDWVLRNTLPSPQRVRDDGGISKRSGQASQGAARDHCCNFAYALLAARVSTLHPRWYEGSLRCTEAATMYPSLQQGDIDMLFQVLMQQACYSAHTWCCCCCSRG